MVLVSILSIMVFLGIIMVGIFGLTSANLNRSKTRVLSLEAQYAAESGADAAVAILNSGNDTYTGTGATSVAVLTAGTYKASYTVTVANGSTSKERIITAVGKVFSPKTATTPTSTRTVRITAQRSSVTTASSVVSRNILSLDSGIKNLYAKDVYINGFIEMNKNTTNLVAENIVVAGKNTGASNCSIGGSGNLVKPASFTNPGQTKTNITTAFNNCISPPGNARNANFNVLANQSNISTLQSTYVPWGQYMDSSYQNSPGGCSDWTTGASPRTIPSTGNTKKTHYPDSGSNVATTCGTSGDLNLGSSQYKLMDNVHIRANLCAASACSPTFNNPDATVKYIFVEGTVNFDSVNTTSTSGPIVIITYGADPASKTGSCPYGGSIYVGNGNTSAPDLYLLATNGLCMDKTKFSSAPALGGVGGKNIYIATNPGSPWDLKLDPTFPVNSIPLDLSWRVALYQQL
jgi:hypothetical protein